MNEYKANMLKSEDDYITWIKPRLEKMSPRQRAAFSCAAAEREFGTYAYFARRDSRMGPDILRTALDMVWAFAAGENVPVAALEESKRLVERLIPDLDDPEAPEQAPLVLEAAAAVTYALQVALSGNPKYALSAALSARTAVHDWVDQLLRPGLTVLDPGEIQATLRQIDQHPLMVREHEQVRKEVEFLLGQPEMDGHVCSQLKALWPNSSKSNIDLE